MVDSSRILVQQDIDLMLINIGILSHDLFYQLVQYFRVTRAFGPICLCLQWLAIHKIVSVQSAIVNVEV